jgi:hypothetical protein
VKRDVRLKPHWTRSALNHAFIRTPARRRIQHALRKAMVATHNDQDCQSSQGLYKSRIHYLLACLHLTTRRPPTETPGRL